MGHQIGLRQRSEREEHGPWSQMEDGGPGGVQWRVAMRDDDAANVDHSTVLVFDFLGDSGTMKKQ